MTVCVYVAALGVWSIQENDLVPLCVHQHQQHLHTFLFPQEGKGQQSGLSALQLSSQKI